MQDHGNEVNKPYKRDNREDYVIFGHKCLMYKAICIELKIQSQYNQHSTFTSATIDSAQYRNQQYHKIASINYVLTVEKEEASDCMQFEQWIRKREKHRINKNTFSNEKKKSKSNAFSLHLRLLIFFFFFYKLQQKKNNSL